MAGGFKHRPRDEQAVAKRFRDLETQLAQARRQSGNASLHSAFSPRTVDVGSSLIPIQAGTVGASALTETVAVPDGFTGASVILTVALDGLRDASTGGGNTLTIQAFADTVRRDPLTRTFTAAGSQGSVTQSLAATLAGLSGSFQLGALGWGAASGWVPDSGVCHLSALIFFLR